MSINTNHIFLALDREIDRAGGQLQSRLFGACRYSSEVLADRLMQRLVEICLTPFTVASISVPKATENRCPSPGARINCGQAVMEIGSGRVTVTPRQWLVNQLCFVLHWMYCLFAIVAVRSAGKDSSPAVLVFGVGEEALFIDDNDHPFVSFCRAGPIAPLRNGKRFIVQSSSADISSSPLEFEYCRRPLISLLRGTKLGILGRLSLLADHLGLFLAYVSSSIRLPHLALLARDFAYSSVAFALDRRGTIDSIVLTSANHPSQPLWMRALRHARIHMVWYSQAAKPIIFASDPCSSDVPSYRWIRVDTHWVWTRAFAEYLRRMGQQQIEVVGPIVWTMPEIASPARDTIVLAVFDISPYSDDVALQYGEVPNYNHSNNLFSFIRGVTALKPELEKIFQMPVSIRLKTKRGFKTGYDRGYFDYIESLHSAGTVILAHHATNVYSLISGSHLVMAYPFTSSAYVASYLRVPSIYYDPTDSIVHQDFSDDRSSIGFASRPEELRNATISTLRKVFPEKAVL